MIVECIKIEINNKAYSLSRHSLIITNKEKKKKLLRSHCFLSASSLIKMAKTCRFKVRLVIYFFSVCFMFFFCAGEMYAKKNQISESLAQAAVDIIKMVSSTSRLKLQPRIEHNKSTIRSDLKFPLFKQPEPNLETSPNGATNVGRAMCSLD